MAKKNETGHDDPKLADESGVSRRDLLKSGAVVGLGAAALLEAGLHARRKTARPAPRGTTTSTSSSPAAVARA